MTTWESASVVYAWYSSSRKKYAGILPRYQGICGIERCHGEENTQNKEGGRVGGRDGEDTGEVTSESHGGQTDGQNEGKDGGGCFLLLLRGWMERLSNTCCCCCCCCLLCTGTRTTIRCTYLLDKPRSQERNGSIDRQQQRQQLPTRASYPNELATLVYYQNMQHPTMWACYSRQIAGRQQQQL